MMSGALTFADVTKQTGVYGGGAPVDRLVVATCVSRKREHDA